MKNQKTRERKQYIAQLSPCATRKESRKIHWSLFLESLRHGRQQKPHFHLTLQTVRWCGGAEGSMFHYTALQHILVLCERCLYVSVCRQKCYTDIIQSWRWDFFMCTNAKEQLRRSASLSQRCIRPRHKRARIHDAINVHKLHTVSSQKPLLSSHRLWSENKWHEYLPRQINRNIYTYYDLLIG